MSAAHPLARLKSIPLERLADEPLVGLSRKDYPEYYDYRDRIFAPIHAKPRIVVECDSMSSLIAEVGRTRHLSGKPDLQTRSWKTPALPRTHGHDCNGVRRHRPRHKGRCHTRWKKFCEILRQKSDR
jgi:DNA-binding transcriptional LysR family regulator